MTRGILVAGNESALFSAVEAEAAKRVELYASAVIPGPFTQPQAVIERRGEHKPGDRKASEKKADAVHSGDEKGKAILAWNPSSPLSARTLVLGAENRLDRVDEAFLVCWPPAFYRPAEALAPAEVDKYINDQIKSWMFLVRELAVYFKARNGGTLALITPDDSFGGDKSSAGKDANVDLLGPSAAASFRILAQGLLASSISSSYRILGFTGCNAGAEKEFAAWLFKTSDESGRKGSGRMYKYSKFSLFK